jgi:hypothetical protein
MNFSLVLLSSYDCCGLDLSCLPRELIQLCHDCKNIKLLGFNIYDIIRNKDTKIDNSVKNCEDNWIFSLKRITIICDSKKVIKQIRLTKCYEFSMMNIWFINMNIPDKLHKIKYSVVDYDKYVGSVVDESFPVSC